MDEIEKVRLESLENNIANKIIDEFRKLRLYGDEGTSKRWIWELIQNAKDVVNSSGKIKIAIDFIEEEKKLEFKHNGKPFNTKQLVNLIQQVSSKDRQESGDECKKTTGKFGTGFLTTHLLSTKVKVKGIYQDEKADYKKFDVLLDRSGKEKEQIKQSIKNSLQQMKNSVVLPTTYIADEGKHNTSFTYSLDDEGMSVAKSGLEDLVISIPFVMALIPQIEEVYVKSTDSYYTKLKNTPKCIKLDDYEIINIDINKQGNHQEIGVFIAKLDNLEMLFLVKADNKGVTILPYQDNQPKLFCDFPLIGTNNFSLPVVINSSNFNPTEPRNGIILTDKTDEEIEENKEMMSKIEYLYNKVLNDVAKCEWYGLYNIAKISSLIEEKWYSKKWVEENVVNKCKNIITYSPIIDTQDLKRVAMLDEDDNVQVYILSAKTEGNFCALWELMNGLYPELLPWKVDALKWNESLWADCKNYSIEILMTDLQEIASVENLSKKLGLDTNVFDWLNRFYELLGKSGKNLDKVKNDDFEIFPNQNGKFCCYSQLYRGINISANYKEVLNIIGQDCNEWLIHNIVRVEGVDDLKVYGNKEIMEEIIKSLKDCDDSIKKNAYFKIIQFNNNQNNKLMKVQKELISYINQIYKTEYALVGVPILNGGLLEDAINFIAYLLVDDVSEMIDIEGVGSLVDLENETDILNWLHTFVNTLSTIDEEYFFNIKGKPILPNQKGNLTLKDDLFLDDEIDDTLKELFAIADYDIKEELLKKEIYFQLSKNRQKGNADLALSISRYAKDNYNNKSMRSEEVMHFQRTLFLWIQENEDVAKILFEEICINKHWLYDETDIAKNMKKSERMDSILKKHKINSLEDLDEFLENGKPLDDKVELPTNLTHVELLILSGISSAEKLDLALEQNIFTSHFIHNTQKDKIKYEFVKNILTRAKTNVFKFLQNRKEYDFNSLQELDETIFLIKKNGEDIYIIIRPSDYDYVIIHYDSEKDVLDYEKDWELWVDNGKNNVEKISFGKMLKLTGINKIPLKKVRY